MSFTDKVVIVTGASSGIGAAIAIKFAEEGSKVALVARNEAKLKQIVAKCSEHGKKPLMIIADVTKTEDNKRIINQTITEFGKLDILVNNAGIAGLAAIWDKNAMETYDRVMATNLRSVVHLTHLAIRYLIESQGNIINISSVAALSIVSPEHFAYCTSKAALDHFTKSIALDLAAKGVRANCVNPGPVQTDFIRSLGVDRSKLSEFWERMAKVTALGRVSDPEEIADLVLFIASDKARAITGSSYVTDNGTLLKRNNRLVEDK